jgi:hypothetical protein
VVCGDSPIDRNYLEIAKKAITSSKRATKVSYLVGLPFDELWRPVSSLATDTAILFTTYDKDKNGKKQETTDVGVRLVIRANAPVFSFHEVLLGTGMIGGHVPSSESYGKKTAGAALMLLKGKQPAAISPREELQESEGRFRTLQENVPVGVYRTSHSGKFMSVNPAAFKMFGLDAEEDLSSYQVSDFYNDPEKRRDVLAQLKTAGKLLILRPSLGEKTIPYSGDP